MTDQSNSRIVILVGHCNADVFMLKSALGRFVPNSEIVVANNTGSLNEYLNNNSVLLVNRQLDGRFSTGSGIELISEISKIENFPVSILISNYPDAQQQALAAGAIPGFGKNALYDASTAEILEKAVNISVDSD